MHKLSRPKDNYYVSTSMSNYQYSTGAKRPRWWGERARSEEARGELAMAHSVIFSIYCYWTPPSKSARGESARHGANKSGAERAKGRKSQGRTSRRWSSLLLLLNCPLSPSVNSMKVRLCAMARGEQARGQTGKGVKKPAADWILPYAPSLLHIFYQVWHKMRRKLYYF